MRKSTELKRALLDFLSDQLAPMGFRRSHQSFRRSIAIGKEIMHVAFIKFQDEVEVIVNVEIRHDELERLSNILVGEKPGTPTATIGAEFGQLMASQSSMVWLLKEVSDVPAVGSSILKTLHDVGMPFWEEYASLEKIFEILDAEDPPSRSFCPIPHVRAEKALIASCLLGRHKDYNDLVVTKLKYLVSIGSPYISEFIDFSERLRETLGES